MLKEKIQIDWKKDRKFFIILFVVSLIIILLSSYSFTKSNRMYEKSNFLKATGEIEEPTQGMVVEQQFVAFQDNLEKIQLFFHNYADKENYGGKISIGIRDAENNTIQEDTITKYYIIDSGKYELKFPKQTESQGKKYTIYLRFEDLEECEKFFAIETTDLNRYAGRQLTINGEEQPENCAINYLELYRNDKVVLVCTILMLTMTLATCVMATFIYYSKNIKVEKIFLMIVPVVSILFMITMPTLKNHDEYYHWLKAFEVSKGHFMTPTDPETGVQGSVGPTGVMEINGEGWSNINYHNILERFQIRLDAENPEIINPATSVFYSFVSYVPQATGIILAQLVTNRAYLITYAGRFMNMLVSLTLVYFAIKLMPFGKKMLLIPALLPITIEGFSSLSPDALTISIAFFFIAYVFHLAFGEKTEIRTKEKLFLLGMSVVIALSKIVYLPLVGLILIIPKEKFKNGSNKSKAVNFLIIAIIATLVNLLWLAIAGKYLGDFRGGVSGIKIMQALQNPIEYIQKLLFTLNANSGGYTLSLFGKNLGWGEYVKMYTIVPYTYIALFMFVATTEEELKNKLKTYQFVWIFLVVLAVILLILTSLYVHWTNLDANAIQGVQGRYFLPVLPLVMLLIGHLVKKIHTTYTTENINKLLAISSLFLSLFTIFKIVIENIIRI